MEFELELSFPVIEGITQINSVTINGNNYPVPQQFIITPANVPLIDLWLDSLGYGDFIFELYSGSGGSFVNIYSECSSLLNSTPSTIQLFNGVNDYSYTFQNFECDNRAQSCLPLVVKVDISLDCNNLSCIQFKDVTGAYNATSNPGGYGGPNVPSYAEITGTVFGLYNSNNQLIGNANVGYIPNGGNSVCVPLTAFSTTPLIPGALYYLNYIVEYSGGGSGNEKDCIYAPFIFPCCGTPISSNLGLNFSLQEVSPSNTALIFTDTTGTYNATTNPNGYGGPNPDYSDIQYTVITITLANGQQYTFTNFLPTAAQPSFTIYGYQIGYTGQICDQAITVEYQVFTSGGCQVAAKTSPELLYGQTANCLATRRNAVIGNCSGCDGNADLDSLMQEIIEFDNILNVFPVNAGCVNGLIENLLQQCLSKCVGCQQQ